MGNLANLEFLYLSENENRLSGEIPPELSSLANLELLEPNGNQFSECIPSSLLDELDIKSSHLGGLPFC